MPMSWDDEHERWLAETVARSKSNTHRLDDLERRQDNLDDLVCTVKVLADREERVEDDVREIKADVKTLTGAPGKRWDGLVNKMIWGVVGAVIAWIMARLGF